jgi:ubiquinone/menaquinone biosynthesis C-methylase UbiE
MFYITSIHKFYNKSTNVSKLLFWVVLLLICVSLFKNFKTTTINEGFKVDKKMVFKSNEEIYDDFYADIYDQLFYSDLKDDYQVGMILNKTEPVSESKILDIGSGTGDMVNKFYNKGFKNILGLDKSKYMIKKSKEKYPECKFLNGDVLSSSLFQYNSFTHILCLYFTIYYIPDKYQFFQNSYNWLMPNSYLIVHLVEPKMFDPILKDANPLFLISPQKYAKKRITNSKIIFNNFEYTSNFLLDNQDNALFIEKFSNKEDKNVFLRNEHKLYMENIETIIQIAQDIGFIVSSKIDMVSVQYQYQYLYIFQKI